MFDENDEENYCDECGEPLDFCECDEETCYGCGEYLNDCYCDEDDE